MINTTDLAKINDLKAKIRFYDIQYYENGISEISDAEYDRLYDEYLDYEAQYPELKDMEDAPTRRVGAGMDAGTTSGLPKFTHKSPLLSIPTKSKELSVLRDFFEKCGGEGTKFIVQPKLDGITCNINYENGVLVNAASRGNGTIGDLITENYKMTKTKAPASLPEGEDLEIRGEAIVPYDFFKKHLTGYSNPRSAVVLTQPDVEKVKGKGIQVMFYDIGQTTIPLSDSDFNNLNAISSLGFQRVPQLEVDSWKELEDVITSNMRGMIQEIDGFNILVNDFYPQALCDGMVVKVSSLKKREEIGFSVKGPKWAFAYKFKSLQAVTRIDHIEWQVGKSGRVTPVAVFDEISLGGTKITRATLNNTDYMNSLPVLDGNDQTPGLQADDLIVVERSNDVIPRIIAIQKHQPDSPSETLSERSASFEQPNLCPICHHHLADHSPLLYCTNPTCSAQIKGRIDHYASRDAMNIVGLGAGVVDALFDAGMLTKLSDLYQLKDHREELERLDKFGKVKVNKLLKSIEASKEPELWQFLYALSIEGIGHRASKEIAQHFKTIEMILQSKEEDFLKLEFLGPVLTRSLLDSLNDPTFCSEVHALLLAGVQPKPVQTASSEFQGKSFVITGTLEHPRKTYQDLIESKGGKVSGSVSKKTDVVLIGEDAGSKEEKARKLASEGVPILILDTPEAIDSYLKESH